jgi:hypothetical protein
MNCPSCGKAISKGSVFCQHCGTPIEAKKPKGGWELFKEFWGQLGIISTLMIFVGAQFSVSSVTALIDGVVNPSMNGQAGATVFGVFVKTLPFTAAVAWITVRLIQEKMNQYGELAIVLGLGVVLSYVLSAVLSPDIAQVPIARPRVAGPWGVILALVESFYRAYGAIAFIQSIILGMFFGYWMMKVQEERRA